MCFCLILVNIILDNQYDTNGDVDGNNIINILDIVTIVNWIMNP